MKNLIRKVGMGIVIAGLALSYGCGKSEQKAKWPDERPPAIHLGKDAIIDFKKQVSVGCCNFAVIHFPSQYKNPLVYLEVGYNDFDEDANVDLYEVNLWSHLRKGIYKGFPLTELYSRKCGEKDLTGEDIMGDGLQKRINQEYKQLREQHKAPISIYLGRKLLDTFKEEKGLTDSERLYARIHYLPRESTCLEVLYIDSLMNSNANLYVIGLLYHGKEAKLLTRLCSKDHIKNYGSEGCSIMGNKQQSQIKQEYDWLIGKDKNDNQKTKEKD